MDEHGERREPTEQVDNPAQAEESQEEALTFITPPGRPPLSRRDKLLRGGATGGVVLLALVLVLVASGARLALPWQTANSPLQLSAPYLIQGNAPVQLRGGNWQQIALPVPSVTISDYTVDPTRPDHIILCSAGYTKPVTIWSTEDSGQHWSGQTLPQVFADYCYLSLAADDPARLLVEAGDPSGEINACASEQFFLSEDVGASWRQMPHSSIAPPNSQGSCIAWVTKRHIFIETSYYTYVAGVAVDRNVLERSDDGGQSWQRADAPFHDADVLNIVQSSDGETLLADSSAIPPSADATYYPQLWISYNAGVSWNPESTPPAPGAFDVFAPSRTKAPGWPATPIVYAAAGNQIPASLFRLQVVMGIPGQSWLPLPPLPVPGARADRTGLTDMLGVLPDGRLLALGVDPTNGVPSTSDIFITSQQQWLWLWDPAHLQWQSFPTPLPSAWPDQCSALCWSARIGSNAQGDYLYLFGWGSDAHPIYRVLLPQ